LGTAVFSYPPAGAETKDSAANGWKQTKDSGGDGINKTTTFHVRSP